MKNKVILFLTGLLFIMPLLFHAVPAPCRSEAAEPIPTATARDAGEAGEVTVPASAAPEREQEEAGTGAAPAGEAVEGEGEILDMEIMTPVAPAPVREEPPSPAAVEEELPAEEDVSPDTLKGADIGEPVDEIMPPSVRKAEKEHRKLREIGGEIADADLKETGELMEKAAEGELIIPAKERAPAPPAEALPPEVPAPAASPAPMPEKIPVEQMMILFDFKDADITHVLRLMARKAGVNIIYGPEITGKVSLSLETEILWEKALALILQLHNYAYIRDGNIYRVIPVEELDKEPTQTETFDLSYSTAKEVLGSINQMLTPARGMIKADTRSNTLIVTDVPAKLDQISRIIKKLDRRTPQVLIESRIVELSDDFGEDIGIDWDMLRDWEVSYGQKPGEDDHLMEFTDQLTKVGTRGYTDEFTGQARRDGTYTYPADTQTTQTVLSSFPGVASGTTTTTDTTAGTSTDQWTNQYNWDTSVSSADTSTRTKDQLMTAVLDADQVSIALNFLQEQTDSNIISHPKIVTADSRTASIKVVKQYPIPKFEYNDETGRFAISDFEYKDIGIILDVTPYVNEDNFITLDVAPEVSRYFEQENVSFTGATNVSIPVIHSRRANTRVLILDGDTLVIGGLMSEEEVQLVRKVPFFGDTPFVGKYVFSYSGTSIIRKNLMIFVTATVITDENKDVPWAEQKEKQDRLISEEKEKWWQPKKFDDGLGIRLKHSRDKDTAGEADAGEEAAPASQDETAGGAAAKKQ